MFIKVRLFGAAYAPLFALLAIRFESLCLRVPCIALALVGAGSLLLMMRARRRENREPYELADVQDAGSKTAAYLSAYILPLLSVAYPTVNEIIIYTLFLLLLLIVSLGTDLAQVNPLLYLFRYRVFSIETAGGIEAYLVSKRRNPEAGDVITAVSLTGGVLLERGFREESEETSL